MDSNAIVQSPKLTVLQRQTKVPQASHEGNKQDSTRNKVEKVHWREIAGLMDQPQPAVLEKVTPRKSHFDIWSVLVWEKSKVQTRAD